MLRNLEKMKFLVLIAMVSFILAGSCDGQTVSQQQQAFGYAMTTLDPCERAIWR